MTADVSRTWVPTDDTLGARLALVRQRMGWNAKEAALACGLPPGTWREWEMTGRQPRNFVESMRRIAGRTGVDMLWLMTGERPSPDDEAVAAPFTAYTAGYRPTPGSDGDAILALRKRIGHRAPQPERRAPLTRPTDRYVPAQASA